MPFIQLQFRRDTASNWTTANPLLASGEMAIETDTQLFKIGDGHSTWTQLPYGGIRGPPGPPGGSLSIFWFTVNYPVASGPFSPLTKANSIVASSNMPLSYSIGFDSNSNIRITNSNVTNSNSWQMSIAPISIQYATGTNSIASWNSNQTWDCFTPSPGFVNNTAGTLTIDTTFGNLTGGAFQFSGTGDGSNYPLARIFITPFYLS